MRRAAVLAAAAVLVLPVGRAAAQDPEQARSASGPNVVVVMTDDQRYDDMGPIPKTTRLIGDAGVTFSRYYASYPVCCPARATFFTGQYAQNHHVACLYPDCGGGYGALDQREYLPVWLERAGYATAHIGKFLNGYGEEEGTPLVPKGWTEWYGLRDHSTYRMWGYKIHEKGPGDEDGQTRQYGRVLREKPRYYQTKVLTDKAVDFIRRRAPDAAPFFLSVAYLAPHHESGHTQDLTGKLVRPAPSDRGHYAGLPLPKPPNYNESNLNDKPWFVARWNRPISSRREAAILERLHQRWEALLAVDRGVEKIVEALRRSGELDDTYVIFTSDNGYMQGEHRVPEGKMLPYDASTHLPLIIRGPGIPRGRQTKALVGDVDLASTILEATPARSTRALDGRSMLPFARDVRLRSLRPFLHTTSGQGARGHVNTREGGAKGTQSRVPAWSAVRTTRWLYVEYKGGQREMYDLPRDPWEMRSVVREPRFRIFRNTLRRILGDLRTCRGASCGKIADASVR
jgi:N-acetylglucosamine-6-sulfatase